MKTKGPRGERLMVIKKLKGGIAERVGGSESRKVEKSKRQNNVNTQVQKFRVQRLGTE